jgi:hypothetical protein
VSSSNQDFRRLVNAKSSTTEARSPSTHKREAFTHKREAYPGGNPFPCKPNCTKTHLPETKPLRKVRTLLDLTPTPTESLVERLEKRRIKYLRRQAKHISKVYYV